MEKIYPVTGYPAVPPVSRFVAPWDTSGWYCLSRNLKKGDAVYCNRDDRLIRIKRKYTGGDLIRTFNSLPEGFDDKQEVDFYTESDCAVTLALDSRMEFSGYPPFVAEYADTGDFAETDAGLYRLFTKRFPAGSQVHIPGFKGDFNHFFVIVNGNGEHNPASLPSLSAPPVKEVYKKRKYKSYLHEVFNSPDSLKGFSVSGDVSVVSAHDANDTSVLLKGRASLSKSIKTGTDIVLSVKACVFSGSGVLAKASSADGSGVYISYGNGKLVLHSGKKRLEFAGYTSGKPFRIGYRLDTERGLISLNYESRTAASGIRVPMTGSVSEFSFESLSGSLLVDNLYIDDNRERFIINETFRKLPADISISNGASAKSVPLPFASDRSLRLSCSSAKHPSHAVCSLPFPSVKGELTVECDVKPSDSELFIAPALNSKSGEPVIYTAFYKNNLYASDGGKWVRCTSGNNDFCYFPCKNRYHIKLSADTSSQKYDLWVDGALRAKGFSFMNKAQSLASVSFMSSVGGELLLNSVRVYDSYDLTRGVLPNAPVFDAADFGAVGDGITDDTSCIQEAVDRAAYTGGTVLIKNGVYLTGEIKLASDMTLFIDKSAELKGSNDHSLYPLREPRSSLCAHRQLGRGLLYGEDIRNVTLTGGGMLNGSGKYRFKQNDPLPDRRAEDARPDLVYITYSEDITVDSLNFRNSAFWTIVPLSCGNVTLKHLSLDCLNTPNRDGIDSVDCHDMTIYDCRIMAGDDGLCFKSSDDIGCYNIDAHNIWIQSLASGIKFGTDTYFSFRDSRISDCSVKNVNRCGISLETVDGALVKNVIFERIDMTDTGAPVYITVGCRNRLPRGNFPERKSVIEDVVFDSVRFNDPYPFSYTKNIREVMAVGQSREQCISGVTFRKCFFRLPGGFAEVPPQPRVIGRNYPEYDRHGLSAGYAFTVRFARDFIIEDCEVILDFPDVRPLAAAFDILE